MFGFAQEELLQSRTTPRYLEISHPNTESDLPNNVVVDGKALHAFLATISRIRWRQDADIRLVEAQVDEDFRLEGRGYGYSEVGAILIGTITDGQDVNGIAIEVSNYSELASTRRMMKAVGRSDIDLTGINVTSFDIQTARKKGEVCGWIHVQPGNTLPSVSSERPSDARVSRFIAQRANCPVHLALITDRKGGKITAYLYDDKVESFQKLRGLRIKIPPTMSVSRQERLMEISYTDR